VRTDRGFARIIGFSDGVVAIAITLLVLPLVTTATTIDTDIGTFLVDNAYQLFVFVLSFLVIGRFWMVHHQMYEHATGYNSALLWANLGWLLSIVFLPFPTELLGSADHAEPLTYCLYVGTMILTSIFAALQQWVLIRYPELQAVESRGTLRLQPYVAITVIMVVALVVSVLVPGLGLLALLLLVLATPIEKLIDRVRSRA
jgi:uncharacterized membrane protein